MDELLEDQIVFSRNGTFESGIKEAQDAVELLSETKLRLREGRNISIRTALELQQRMRPSLDAISIVLKETHKSTQIFGRCLDRRVRPKNSAGVEQHFASDILINRAIAMHLLRQGHFETAARFLDEASSATKPEAQREDHSGPTPDSLRDNFLEMYHILHKLRVDRDLKPAKSWAHNRSQLLQSRGSTLEFQLSQLQYVWLLESEHVQSRTLEDRRRLAVTYARDVLGTMTNRYLREIQQLICAVAYTSNTEESPYKQLLKTAGAWEEVATSFTREYCSLLGLSADSPLFIACTAGALALPMLEKLYTIMKEKRTEWTTEHELPVEMPLPLSYRFHPIFVCPVSKEQATQTNPPMLLPCGHVIARESLSRLSKLSKFKCPYCPEESHYKDARQISL